MTTMVAFRKVETGEIKSVKIGWSWTLCFFGGLLGIPFFIRKVYSYAWLCVGWSVICAILGNVDGGDMLIRGGAIGLGVVLGMNGNKWTADYYLKHGWEWAEPTSEEAALAQEKWALA